MFFAKKIREILREVTLVVSSTLDVVADFFEFLLREPERNCLQRVGVTKTPMGLFDQQPGVCRMHSLGDPFVERVKR